MTALAEQPVVSKKGGIADLRLPGRIDVLNLDPRKIIIEHDENTRQLNLDDPIQRAQMDELKSSIAVFGVIVPVGVRYDVGRDAAVLVYGFRRTMAMLELLADDAPIAASIPAIRVKANDETRRRSLNIAENIHVALTELELGHGFQALIDQGWSVEKIADVMSSYKPSRIRACLQLVDSPQAVQKMVASGDVSPSLARQAVRTHGDAAPAVLAERIEQTKAAGKKTATRTKTVAVPKPPSTSTKPDPTDAIGEAAQALFALVRVDDDSDDVRLPKSAFYDLGKALFGEKDARVRALAPGGAA